MADGVEFVVAAYAVIWLGMLLYVLSVGLKLARMAREVELLGRILGDDDSPEADEA